MNTYDRRSFLQLSTAALAAAAAEPAYAAPSSTIVQDGAGVTTAQGTTYRWVYAASDDTFRFYDAHQRLIVTGKAQPAVLVAPVGQPHRRFSSPGSTLPPVVEGNQVHLRYANVNGHGGLSVTWRFEDQSVWLEHVVYDSPAAEDVVSMFYFAQGSAASAGNDGLGAESLTANLRASYFVVPGLSDSPAISPIINDNVHLNESVWLGRGSSTKGTLSQQWGLPVHYLCGFNIDHGHTAKGMYRGGRSDSFTCGLADLPQGDLFLKLEEGNASAWIDYRSDLWGHLRGPGPLKLGATLLWTVAPVYSQAIAAYYAELVRAGVVRPQVNSPRKCATMLTPEYCTWGSQADRGQTNGQFNEEALRAIYGDLKRSGMKAGLFSIDDKWEGAYGKLEHDATRFPHFQAFLDEVRADGYKVGLWAALMRCERPAELGLKPEQLLLKPDGTPYVVGPPASQYAIMDFTQPAVGDLLANLARQFVRRYKPDLLKFDFGYELPGVARATAFDKRYMGERLMARGLEIVIRAMREVNPDLVVMYYNLSPLFLDYFDLHSTDDLFMAAGEYEVEANRRIFFSSLLAPLGVPTYGSSGYDWSSAPEIWFDSAAVGTLGSVNDFTHGDEQEEHSSPEIIARYNGLTQTLRSAVRCEIVPLGTIFEGATMGARAHSWARLEQGKLVLLAYRPPVAGMIGSLARFTDDPRYANLVTSQVPVVVASKTNDPITRCRVLAVVPYGEGELTIRREAGKEATLTSHYFGGATTQEVVAIRDAQLRFSPRIRHGGGSSLEWIEVQIT